MSTLHSRSSIYHCDDHRLYKSFLTFQTHDPPARIERRSLRLQNYDFNVKFKPGKDNPADCRSRHPVNISKKKHNSAEEYVNFYNMPRYPYRPELSRHFN